MKAAQPPPEGSEHTVQDAEATRATLLEFLSGIPEKDRTSKRNLTAAARVFKQTSAPGPDGASGGLLKRWPTIFPDELGDVLERLPGLLSTTEDNEVPAARMATTI